MKILLIFISLFISNTLLGRDVGETEITTEEGIEVFQDEKYYLLKKNVKIVSDNFILYGDEIKIYFEKDLYDIQIIDAVGNVKLDSSEYGLNAKGNSLLFKVIPEEIFIQGENSKLITKDAEMYSDGNIKVNNLSGDFLIEGKNSSLKSQNIFIEGFYIDGIFSQNTEEKDITLLNVIDDNIAYVKTDNTDMYANNIKYNKETSTINLENNVKIIRDGETITGDYGNMNTETKSYKVKSKESKKVKVIILDKNE